MLFAFTLIAAACGDDDDDGGKAGGSKGDDDDDDGGKAGGSKGDDDDDDGDEITTQWDKDEIEEKVSRALEMVRLPGVENRMPSQLSGGEKQRVGIARALMQEPEMILADEPVASLDPALAHSIMRHLLQINQEDGITVLCSLHFLDLVQQYSTRAIALNDGVALPLLNRTDTL